MNTETAEKPLDRDTAIRLCREVQDGVRGKPWSAAWWQCSGSRRFSRGDPDKMCIGSQPGYRGCKLVNERLVSSAA
jgi:hypothetical protein